MSQSFMARLIIAQMKSNDEEKTRRHRDAGTRRRGDAGTQRKEDKVMRLILFSASPRPRVSASLLSFALTRARMDKYSFDLPMTERRFTPTYKKENQTHALKRCAIFGDYLNTSSRTG